MGKKKKEYFLLLVLAIAGVFNHYVLGLNNFETISVLLLLSICFMLVIILDRVDEHLGKK